MDAKNFSGKYVHRTIKGGIGHNLPQEATQAFADAVIDLLVNNAGIYIPKPFTDYTPEDFEAMISTNIAGYFFITQQAVAQMRKQKSGHIVSISTTWRADFAASHNQVNNARVQPSLGNGMRGRRHSSQYDLTGSPEFSDARERRPSDGRLDVKLTVPGTPGNGTNPEQLFAVGWSACFVSAIKFVAAKMKVKLPADVAIDPEVDLSTSDDGYSLQARLNVSLPGLDREIAQKIVNGAEQTRPYSKATRGNIHSEYNLV